MSEKINMDELKAMIANEIRSEDSMKSLIV